MSLWSAAGTAIGAYFGGAPGAAIGAKIGGQMDTNQANQDIAASNNAWSAQQYATRYQTMTNDLKAAGLNPMLAYSQSPGTAPTAQAVQFQNPFSDIGQTVQQFASASQADAQVKLTESNVDKVKAEIENIPLEGRRLERLSALLAEQLNVAFQETQSKIKSIQVMDETIKKIRSETRLLDNQAAVEAALDNLGRTSKELAPAVSILLDLVRAGKR